MSKFTLTLFFKDMPLKSLELNEGTVTVGRDEGNDLQIDSLAVAPRHASIYFGGSDKVVWQLNPDFPLTVNGNPVGEHRLQHGDRIGVGKHEIRFAESGFSETFGKAQEPGLQAIEDASPPIQPALIGPRAHLQVLKGKNLGVVIPIVKDSTRLGTEDAESAVIDHGKEVYLLSALVAGHAVVVNGEEVRDRSVRLRDGDVFRVGETEYRFFCESAPR